MTEPEIPAYILPSVIAKACGTNEKGEPMTQRAALSLIQRAGIAEKIGGRWCAGKSRLRETLSEVYDSVYTHLSRQQETDANQRQATPTRKTG